MNSFLKLYTLIYWLDNGPIIYLAADSVGVARTPRFPRCHP